MRKKEKMAIPASTVADPRMRLELAQDLFNVTADSKRQAEENLASTNKKIQTLTQRLAPLLLSNNDPSDNTIPKIRQEITRLKLNQSRLQQTIRDLEGELQDVSKKVLGLKTFLGHMEGDSTHGSSKRSSDETAIPFETYLKEYLQKTGSRPSKGSYSYTRKEGFSGKYYNVVFKTILGQGKYLKFTSHNPKRNTLSATLNASCNSRDCDVENTSSALKDAFLDAIHQKEIVASGSRGTDKTWAKFKAKNIPISKFLEVLGALGIELFVCEKKDQGNKRARVI